MGAANCLECGQFSANWSIRSARRSEEDGEAERDCSATSRKQQPDAPFERSVTVAKVAVFRDRVQSLGITGSI
jgi:hypothetical protein